MNLKARLILSLTSALLLVNSRADITNGLVLYLNLNEGTGTTINDSSGLGNNGAIVNVAGSAQWTSGWVAGGLAVNSPIPANTNYISIPDAASLNFTNQNTFTLAAWVKMPSSGQLAGAGVIAKGTGNGGEQYDLDVNGGATPRYRLVVRNAGGTATTATATVAPANNAWQHVVAVYDGTNTVSKTIRLYLNGVQNIAVTNNANFTSLRFSSNPVAIGARQGSTAPAYGLVVTNTTFDEVRLYNRPLSASDVYELYASNGKLAAITTQPRSITNYVGDYAPFNVAIDNNNSTLPVGYQWQWYGTNLPGATAATLVFTNVQVANSGPYSVTISNVIGTTNSATVYLQVQPLPASNIASGLVGYYKFDDSPGSTTAADSSGNGNPGTLTGYLDFTACWVTGLTNGALSFNTDTNALTVDVVAIPAVGVPAPPVLDFYGSQAVTVAAWVKGTLPQTNGAAIVAKGNGGGGEQFALDVNGGNFRFYTRSNTAAVNLNTAVPMNGAWQHVAAVLDVTNGIMSLYVNGQLAAVTVAPTSLNTNSHEVSIGNRQSAAAAYNLPFSGAIDDVHLYNRALTSADIATLYAAGGLYPPSFAIQPQGASLYVGQDYTFSATVGGTAPFTYQWKTNGVNLAGATSSTLVLTNLQLANAGTYVLWATNGYGFTNSQPAVLQITNFYLTNMLAAWWTFDDGSGTTAADSSANGNNGALINFPGDDSGWVPGRVGLALNFINNAFISQERVAIPDSPSLNFDTTLQFTLAAWVNGAVVQSNSAAVICKGTGSGGEQYCIDANGVAGTPAYRFFCRNAAGTTTAIVLTNAPNGQWQHLAVAFDGVAGFIRMYLNGQLVATNTAPTSLLANFHEVSIGNRPSAADIYGFPFTGQIDDVRVYTRALSATDVQALYAQAPLLPVVFYTQPAGSARWVGDTYLLSAAADGSPPLSYQWLKDGTNVPGATATSLLLTNLQLTDGGDYRLQVSNAAGPSNSAIASVSVSIFDISKTVAYWKFDDGSGATAADSSGNGNAGTLNNFPGDNSEWVPGRVAGALACNTDGSTDDYVSIPDAPVLNFDTRLTFSIAAWVRGPAVQVNGGGLICKGTGTGGEQFAIDTHNDTVTAGYRFYVRNAAGVSVPLPTPVAPNGRWQHLAAVYDGFVNTMQVYVDGQLVASGAGTTSLLPNTHEVSIGNRQSGAATPYNAPFNGVMDDVRFYNRALKSTEVQQIYALAGTLPPTVFTQPQNVTNYARGSASFSVVADGTGTLSYQWLKNGTSISGATATRLSLADLQLADAASYSVRVTDANSFVLSSSASLTVLTLPPPDLTNEMIAYWTFDETNGTAIADSSGRGNSATLFDFPPNDVQWVPGVLGGALHFSNGGDITYTNYRVGTDNPLTLDNTDLFSFSFWAKRDPGYTGVNPRFITPNNGQNWVLWTPATGVGFFVPAKSTEPSSDAWHHFVVLYNRPAGTYSLFVDGARQVTDVGGYVRNDPTSAPWFIGHSESATSPVDSFTGLMDDLRVYNRLLNYNDVQALYLLAGAPLLSVSSNARSITVSWPSAATAYQLQSAGAVSGVIWSNEPATPLASADGASLSLTFSADAQAERYYRLKQKP